jgi:hypothetical protein
LADGGVCASLPECFAIRIVNKLKLMSFSYGERRSGRLIDAR